MKPSLSHDLPIGQIDHCQVCFSRDLELIHDLGFQAPCDSLLNKAQLSKVEKTYPLRFWRCSQCTLAQIDYVVAPEELFYPEYPYQSGITETLSKNLQAIAVKLSEVLHLPKGSFVVDIGSNDGTILQGFKSTGMKVLGVEPTNIAAIAIERGIPTIQKFFSEQVAREIRDQHGKASVVTGANMFAHVANLGGLIRGAGELLTDDGMFLTESHYLVSLLRTVQYDSIYHEHLKYYSLRSLVTLFDQYDFTVVDAELIPNYGGSVRVYAQKGKKRKTTERLGQLLREEHKVVGNAEAFHRFREQVVHSKIELQALMIDAKRRGKKVVGVGCPGRASTLLNYCQIDVDLMPYIAEQASCLKVGLFLPGKHIPIVDEALLFRENPDYALMLSWHYASPIMKKLREKGLKSKFIVPLPSPQIVD